MKNNLVLHSLGHAVLTVGYITLVGLFISHGNALFGVKDTFLTPMIVLTLFVLSAAVVGTLVLGRPILLYMDGKKNEALKFFGYTVGWLFVALVILIFSNLK